jgi:sucrose-6-phosphate hydrolase SacC (GH32 family)
MRKLLIISKAENRKVIFIDQFEAPYDVDAEDLHLRVVIDQSSVELFTGDGIRSITVAIFVPVGTQRGLTRVTE